MIIEPIFLFGRDLERKERTDKKKQYYLNIKITHWYKKQYSKNKKLKNGEMFHDISGSWNMPRPILLPVSNMKNTITTVNERYDPSILSLIMCQK